MLFAAQLELWFNHFDLRAAPLASVFPVTPSAAERSPSYWQEF